MFVRRLLVFLKSNQSKAISFSLFEAYKSRGAKFRNFNKLGPFYALSLWTSSSSEKNELTTKEILIAKADAFFDQGKYNMIYNMLITFKDDKDVEILWRLGRALYKMSLSASDVQAKKLISEAYDMISSAVSIQEDNWAVQKWMAIILNAKSTHEGLKSRINQLYNVKKHMIRASELNPEDATTLYLIGNWCFQIAALTWYQRKIASTIFGTAPSSSYEEALRYFQKAEETNPNFYSQNLLMLGKTYSKLDKREEAIKYLKRASEYIAKNDEDVQAKQEASRLLKNI